jgi:hypothetical protein
VSFGILGRIGHAALDLPLLPHQTMTANAPKKATYRVRNWKEYDAALVRRGALSLWVEEATLQAWRYQGPN